MHDLSTLCPEILGREYDLTASGDDVFDDEKAPLPYVAPFAYPFSAVLLRLLAYEEDREARYCREHRGNGDTSQLEAGQAVGVGWHQWHHLLDDLRQQGGIRFEAVLIEIPIRGEAGPCLLYTSRCV